MVIFEEIVRIVSFLPLSEMALRFVYVLFHLGVNVVTDLFISYNHLVASNQPLTWNLNFCLLSATTAFLGVVQTYTIMKVIWDTPVSDIFFICYWVSSLMQNTFFWFIVTIVYVQCTTNTAYISLAKVTWW